VADLLGVAERALAHAGEEAQVTAWWERRVWAEPGAAAAREWLSVEVLVVHEGGAGRVATESVDDEDLRRAAAGARRIAETGAPDHPGLPEPAPGRPHEGWDPAILGADPADVAAALATGRRWAAAAARTAIVSTRGVRAYEQRTHARASSGAAETAAARIADVRELSLPRAAGSAIEPGEYAAVLGPAAVATALRRVPSLAEHRGRRIASAAVNLSQSPRFATTLPRSYDLEGRPLAPAPLIQDGVATGNPAGDHLVLVGGGADGVEELAAPLARGLYLPTLALAVPIRDGALVGAEAAEVRADVEPLELLGAVQALTSSQWTIPTAQRSARTAGATVCPAMRVGGGVRVR
jgi:hypothetical protein